MFRLVCLVLFCLFSSVAYSDDFSLDREGLIAKVEERWSFIEQRDFEKAYEYETPEYRKVFSKKMYVASFGFAIDWKLLKVVGEKLMDGTNIASVEVEFETKTIGTNLNIIPVVKHEKWLHIDGKWWHSFDG